MWIRLDDLGKIVEYSETVYATIKPGNTHTTNLRITNGRDFSLEFFRATSGEEWLKINKELREMEEV